MFIYILLFESSFQFKLKASTTLSLQVSCKWHGGGWRGTEVWNISMGSRW